MAWGFGSSSFERNNFLNKILFFLVIKLIKQKKHKEKRKEETTRPPREINSRSVAP